jgi:hypothetical protein
MSKITNHKLRELLVELGFAAGERTERNHRIFRHPVSGCVLLLPDNKSQEQPRPADLVGVKAHLSIQGHLDEESFDHFVTHGELPTKVK